MLPELLIFHHFTVKNFAADSGDLVHYFFAIILDFVKFPVYT